MSQNKILINRGLSVNKLHKIGRFKVPKKAVTYDFVSGSGKYGDYEIYSFKNKNGKLIKRGTSFFNEIGEEVKHVVANYFTDKQGAQIIRRSTIENGKETSFKSNLLCWFYIPKNGFLEKVKKFFHNIFSKKPYKTRYQNFGFLNTYEKVTPEKDTHGQILKRKNKPISSINYDVYWDGSPIEIKTENANINLDCTDHEMHFLPFIKSGLSTKRAKQKLELIKKIMKKYYEIEDIPIDLKYGNNHNIMPNHSRNEIDNDYLLKFKVSEQYPQIYQKLIDSHATHAKGYAYANTNFFTGEIYLSRVLQKVNPGIFCAIAAHEFRHAFDGIHLLLLEDFKKNNIDPMEKTPLNKSLQQLILKIVEFQKIVLQHREKITSSNPKYKYYNYLLQSLATYQNVSTQVHNAHFIEQEPIKEQSKVCDIFTKLQIVTSITNVCK